MFDRTKERIAKLEETNETFRKVKAHVEKYQIVYACGGTAIVCIVGTRTFGRPMVINNVIDQAAPVVPSVVNTINNTVNNTVNNGGHMRKIVRCLETDEMWPSVSKAAEAMGVTLPLMSHHLNGRHDHINDLHFVIEGLSAG